jgi:CubicO group peptidase (beta-lactamase class C family)
MMLAKIVEQVSGESFSKFLATRVFAPLEMSDSQLNDDSTLVIANRATGYADRSDPAIRKELASVGITVRAGPGFLRLPRIAPHYGGSGVFSTVEDLAKWDASFDSNKLAGPQFTQLMLRREKFRHDKDNDALGLVFGDFGGRPMLWFSGGDLDSSTYMARLPEEHLTVICLSNMPRGHAEDKARAVLSIALNSNTDARSAK